MKRNVIVGIICAMLTGCWPVENQTAKPTETDWSKDPNKFITEYIVMPKGFPDILLVYFRGHDYMGMRGNYEAQWWFHAPHCPCMSNEVRTLTRGDVLRLNSVPRIEQ